MDLKTENAILREMLQVAVGVAAGAVAKAADAPLGYCETVIRDEIARSFKARYPRRNGDDAMEVLNGSTPAIAASGTIEHQFVGAT